MIGGTVDPLLNYNPRTNPSTVVVEKSVTRQQSYSPIHGVQPPISSIIVNPNNGLQRIDSIVNKIETTTITSTQGDGQLPFNSRATNFVAPANQVPSAMIRPPILQPLMSPETRLEQDQII